MPSHDERYGRAEDYVNVVYKLWEASWEDDAVVADRERGVYADPAKIHRIDHVGPYYDVAGPHITQPSPQRTPYLFNAAVSGRGIAFAGANAEVLFTSGGLKEAPESAARLRAAAVASGRKAEDVKIFGGFGLVLGSTTAEAIQLDQEVRKSQILESILVKYSGFWQDDLGKYPLNASVAEILDSGAARGATASVLAGAADKDISFETFMRGAANHHTVGTPEQIVDEIVAWQDAGIDGLNLHYLVSPGTYEDFVEQVRPILVERGLMQEEYAPGTVWEKATGLGPYLPASHPAQRARRALEEARSQDVAEPQENAIGVTSND